MYSLKPSVPRALRNHAKRAAMSGDQEEPPNKRSRTENRASSSAVELPQAPLAGPSSAYTLETSSAAEISAYNQGLRESAASTANLRPLYYPKLAPTEITRDYSKPVPLPLAPPTNFLQVAPKKPGKVHPNTRDFKAQLKAALPTREHMNRFIAALDVVHKKPLSPSTVENYERAKRWWLLFFEEQTGSEEQAQLTLARDAPAPPITLFKCFLLFAATQGNSHIHKGGKGWSVKTLKMFCTRVFAMRLYYNCAPPPRQYCQEVYNAIDAWLIEGVLHADSHDKQIIRESDLVNMLSAFLRGQSDVSSRFMLVQAMWFLTFLYETGARPGTVVQSPGFRHTDHYLKWEDSKWIVTGWTEKLGLTIEVHWRLRWAKGMHMDNSKFMCVYQRNHELERAHIDSITMLEALAVHQDIFEIDPLQLRSRDPKTLKLPIELKMKPDKGKLPVLMNRKKDDVLGYSTLMAILKRVASALGYKRFIPRYMRYGWATAMAKRLSKANLRYFLGHVHKSKHGETTYQSTIQPVDVAAMRFDEISNTETAEYLSSIAYGAEDAQDVSLSLDQLERDPYLQDLLAVYREKEAKVVAQYHCLSHEVTEESLDNSLVSEAQDAWSDVLERYFSMVSKVKIGERVVFDDAPANAPSHDEPKDDDEDDEKLSSEVPVEKNPEFKLPQDVDPEILSKIFSHQSSKLDALVNSDNDHPLVPLVQDAKSNVRGLLLKTYVNLLEEDNLANKHQCPTCMSKPNLPIEKRTKDHKDHWAQHYLSCMFNDASDKNLFICPLCLVCFANPPPGETQLDIYDKEIDEHVEACLTKMMARKFDGSDPSEEEPARKSTRRNNDYGVGTLSVTTRLGGSRTSTTRYFCPVCLFDKSVTGDARTRWNHRLHWTLAVVPLLLHMSANHWNRIGTGNGIDYHKTFTCGFPDCPNEQEEFKTGTFINHLHSVHGYKLIECPIDHCDDSCKNKCQIDHHSDFCGPLELHGRFLYTRDAKAELKLLKRDLPAATVIDHRPKGQVNTALKKIEREAAAATQFPPPIPDRTPSPPPLSRHRQRQLRDEVILTNRTRRGKRIQDRGTAARIPEDVAASLISMDSPKLEESVAPQRTSDEGFPISTDYAAPSSDQHAFSTSEESTTIDDAFPVLNNETKSATPETPDQHLRFAFTTTSEGSTTSTIVDDTFVPSPMSSPLNADSTPLILDPELLRQDQERTRGASTTTEASTTSTFVNEPLSLDSTFVNEPLKSMDSLNAEPQSATPQTFDLDLDLDLAMFEAPWSDDELDEDIARLLAED